MDKFCWKENEIDIADSLCDLCEFKFDNIPQEYYNNDIKCPFFAKKGRIIL